ncbi:hypothetical protein [Alcaligenes endophyticus]|uniref:NERD domain-containing protein n=1 Tax=Alcaligenes endophyticus TaxID=1929088 RepID=A0ABT8EJ19_9BURK|nr:hypothetical protein [Alcaligenes endophyticus]MCX5591607.1 hypothetical protein [Alcaligenes endophyticus]MDN4121284.1 hypothetical protein [Alcaligenes endophyticus]
MLSLLAPDITKELLLFPGGIHCVRLNEENVYRIILKLPVNYLLPMKTNKGFKIYVSPIEVSGTYSVGLLCAFFDDPDAPLTCLRFLDHSSDTLDMIHALSKREAMIHIFDEQNRELLGYSAEIKVPLTSKVRLEHANLSSLEGKDLNAASEQAMIWFGLRDAQEDADAIQVNFTAPLFPEDIIINDLRPELHFYHGNKGFGFTSLERENAGLYQELDIINLLHRVFKPEQIYHAPKRFYDKEEIADIIIITDSTCLIIQAKDSPNTAQIQSRTLQRKRLASIKMLKSALKQISGAVNYVDTYRPFKMLMDGQEISINLGKRQILSLAIVREMFNDTYNEYSQELFSLFNTINLPCIALDYAELHRYTTYCSDEGRFLGAYFQVFNFALSNGCFPRLRFGPEDAVNWMNEQGIDIN